MASIFKRLNDVINSNINDLIDRVEDPERMIKQIIREMDDNIRGAKEGIVEAIASEKKLAKDLEVTRKQSGGWQQKAEAALRDGNEELARAALVRKNEYDNVLKSLEPAWEAAKKTSDSLKAQLKALEAKLDEANRKKGTLVARQRAAEARQHMESTAAAFESGMDAHDNFSRMEDKVADIEARTEAMAELNSDSDSLEEEFKNMEVDTEVDAELAELKKKMGV